MDMASLLLLLSLAALGWFWFDSMSALEVARNAGRQICGNANVQFLDDTVAGTGLALVRDESGSRALRRTYRFEFSETGNSRLEGKVILLGSRIESVTMEPYQILLQTDSEPVLALNPCDDPNLPDNRNTFTDNGGTYDRPCGGCGKWGGPGARH
jgi:hypothetical protein